MQKLKKSKKGASQAIINTVIGVIIGVVILFNVLGNTSTTLTDAADNVSGSGLPLASLFASNGVLLLAFMGGIVLILVNIFLAKQKKG